MTSPPARASAPEAVLLTCLSRSTGLTRFPAVFARAGIPIELVAPADEPPGRSRFVRRHHACDRSPGALVRTVSSLMADRPGLRVVWGDDLSLQSAIEHGDPGILATLPVEAAKMPAQALVQKTAMETWARGAGIPLPETRIVASRDEAVAAAESMGGPVILKPSRGQGGSGIVQANHAGDLAARWVPEARGPWVLQEYITGRHLILDLISRRGRALLAMTCEKVESHGAHGYSLVRRYERNEAAAELGRRLCEASGFHGVGGADIIQDRQGRVRLIELTLRPCPGPHLPPLMGVDVASLYRDVFLGEESAADCQTIPMGPTTHVFFPEAIYSNVLRMKLGRAVRHMANPATWRAMSWNDPPVLRWHWSVVLKVVADKRHGVMRRLLRGRKRSP